MGKVHYSHGLHCSPWPQWHTRVRPSMLVQLGGLWPTHASRARLVCARRAVTTQSAASARGAAQDSTVWWRVIGDEVFESSILIVLANSHYIEI
jgi:hypothetical protein